MRKYFYFSSAGRYEQDVKSPGFHMFQETRFFSLSLLTTEKAKTLFCLTSLPTQDLRNWEILEYFQKRENAEPSTLPSRNKILILLVVKNYAKADTNKVFLSCPILFDLLILFHKLCQRLKIHLAI